MQVFKFNNEISALSNFHEWRLLNNEERLQYGEPLLTTEEQKDIFLKMFKNSVDKQEKFAILYS